MHGMVCFLLLALLTTIAAQAADSDSETRPYGLYNTVSNSEEETIAAIERAKSAGITVLYPSLSGGGGVIWKTDREVYYPPLAETYAKGWDPLESLIRHAHAAGIKVYPSIAIGPMTRGIEQNPGWETIDRNGDPSSKTTARSFSLSIPEARAFKIATIMDLVNGYAVDGIMLDYCRYPETTSSLQTRYGFYGYDQPILDACRLLHGFDPRGVPIDSPLWNKFNQMRMDTVTAFVREMRAALQSADRKVRLGGFGDIDPEHEARMCGRDWLAWCNEGYLDDFFLAVYNNKLDEMPEIVRRVRSEVPPNVMVHSSLAPFNRFLSSPEEMLSAAQLQLDAGADALWIYREDYLTELQLWPAAGEVARLWH